MIFLRADDCWATTLEQSGEFAEAAANAVGRIPELAGLSGNALIQTFLFHQFSLLLLLVPIVSATALATHAVIGEKQSKALEPLLATPISTLELLAAKTLTPFLFALGLTWARSALEVVGADRDRRARRVASDASGRGCSSCSGCSARSSSWRRCRCR